MRHLLLIVFAVCACEVLFQIVCLYHFALTGTPWFITNDRFDERAMIGGFGFVLFFAAAAGSLAAWFDTAPAKGTER